MERPLSPVEFLFVGCFWVVLSLLCLRLGVVEWERWILGFFVVSYGWNLVDFSLEDILYTFVNCKCARQEPIAVWRRKIKSSKII